MPGRKHKRRNPRQNNACDAPGIRGVTVERLREIAKNYKIKGYYAMKKAELCEAIKKVGDDKLKYWMQDVCIREAMLKTAVGQQFIDKCTKAGRARAPEKRYMPYFTSKSCVKSFWTVFSYRAKRDPLLNERMTNFVRAMNYLPSDNETVKQLYLAPMLRDSKEAYDFFFKYKKKPVLDAIRDGLIYVLTKSSEAFRKSFFEFFADLNQDPWLCYPQLKDYPFEKRVLEHPSRSPYRIAQPIEEYRKYKK